MNYQPTHEALIEAVLNRLDHWPPDTTQLPQPLSIETGIAGESIVYLFRLASAKSPLGLGLVAKFESNPDRAKREWSAISELRKEYRQFQHGVMLPIDGNIEADGVAIFPLAGQDSPGMECTSILKVLRKQLADALPNCRDALNQATTNCLDRFHSDAQWADLSCGTYVQRWRDIFAIDEASTTNAFDALRKTGVVEDEKLGRLRVRDRTLVDPTTETRSLLDRSLLDRSIARCKRGRIHGDLNLTNVLSLLDAARKSWGAYGIDFFSFTAWNANCF
jgi:hypothetical protein